MHESSGWVLEGFVTPTRVAVRGAKILWGRTIHQELLTIDETRSCWFEWLSCASTLGGWDGFRC